MNVTVSNQMAYTRAQCSKPIIESLDLVRSQIRFAETADGFKVTIEV